MCKGLLLIAMMLVVAACGGTTGPATPPTTERPPEETAVCTPVIGSVPTPDIALEEAAVYAAAIQFYLRRVPDPLVVADQTEVDIDPGTLTEIADYLTKNLPEMNPETLASFRARNDRAYTLSQTLLPYRPILLTEEEVRAFFLPNGGGWEAFYQQYPNAQGIMHVSRVGFNTTMTQALVYVGNQSHYLAGAGLYYLLAKEDGVWRVTKEVWRWIS